MTVNLYAANPLADAAREGDPAWYAAISAAVPAPKMFAGGTADLPAFTASGIDPQLLLRLPYGVRHAAAAEPNLAAAHTMFESYGNEPTAVVDHPGLQDAQDRVNAWWTSTDPDTRTPEQKQAAEDAAFAAYFGGDAQTARAAQLADRAAVVATNRQRTIDYNTWAAAVRQGSSPKSLRAVSG